ncbi:MAG: ribonuclease P protein subunit [Candidatus Diapherotrites archaeon]
MYEKFYSINRKNILGHELNGLKINIINSSDPKKIGVNGVIVKETKNTFVIESQGKEKIVPKKEVLIEFEIQGEKIAVNGKELIARPEDRIKKMFR